MNLPSVPAFHRRSSNPANTMLVNRRFVENYLRSGQVLGLHLQQAFGAQLLPPVPVRGIVADVREQGVETEAQPTVYVCSSAPMPDPYFLLRTRGEPAAMADTLREKIHEWEPQRSVFSMTPLEDRLIDRRVESRLRTVLLSSFAAAASALVGLGLYGTISYQGRLRRREVGLRLALGALPRQIVQGFLIQGLQATLAGLLIGLALSAWLTRLLAGMLYSISPLDPATYGGVLVLTLLIVGRLFFPFAARGARPGNGHVAGRVTWCFALRPQTSLRFSRPVG